jgi:hypothetical protein
MSDGNMPGRFRVTTWVVRETRDIVFDGSAREENPLREATSITVPLFTFDVRLTPRVGVQVSTGVPVVTRTGMLHRAGGDIAFNDEVRGLGDTVAGAWYRGSPGRWTWTLNGGLSLPTGSTRTPRFRPDLQDGSLVPMSRLQRGTGTWDPVIGLAVERPVAGGRWVSNVAARTPPAENGDGLRTGASWELGSGWAHILGSHRVMGYARVDWLHREQDVFQGIPVLVGGGNWIYAAPGFGVMLGKGLNVQAEVKVPVYRDLANRQLDSRAIFQFGMSRSF